MKVGTENVFSWRKDGEHCGAGHREQLDVCNVAVKDSKNNTEEQVWKMSSLFGWTNGGGYILDTVKIEKISFTW